jgi:hypothetical protein
MAGSLVDRMVGAAFLNVDTYEEVEHDETATGQAAAVVAMVAVAMALGGWNFGVSAVVGGAVTALVKWLMWAGITYLVGTMLFGGTATWGELLRTLGFAQAPGILAVLAIIPVLGWFVLLGVSVWVAVAAFIAIRQALDISNGKTFLTVLVGFIVSMVLSGILPGSL